jgi:transposase
MSVPDCPGCRERDAIIAQLQAKIAVLEARVAELEQRVAELQGRLSANSSNSSLPPSADPPSAPKPPTQRPTGRKPGGQPGHRGHTRRRLPPDQIVIHAPTHCDRCQAELSPEPSATDPSAPWHQVIELPTRAATVIEHQVQARTCPRCGHVSRGRIPPEILAHGFGPNLTAAIAFLSGACHGSKRIILEILQGLLGIPLSLGSVANAEQEVSAALQPPCAELEPAIRQAEIKNADETGWAQRGKSCWLWLAVTAGGALFKVCQGRGRQALAELLGSRIHGVVGSDRWGAYRVIDLEMRQLCWAHEFENQFIGFRAGAGSPTIGDILAQSSCTARPCRGAL